MASVLDIQRALKARGFDPGPLDGDPGPRTEAAVRAFQRSAGLLVDGVAGPITLAALAADDAHAAAVMTVSPRGIVELASHEAIVTSPYRDSVGIWTIGIGHTAAAGAPVPASLSKTVALPVESLIEVFRRDLARYETDVRQALTVAVAQHQFDALVSFHFNTGGVSRASLIRKLNSGDLAGTAAGFLDWRKPAAVLGRRRREQALFRDGVYSNDGTVAVYPADSAGRVQWSRGRRITLPTLAT